MSRTPKGLRLAAALRAARESRGLTLRELGERIGRNSGVVSRYETADRTPKPEDVAQLLTALEIRGDQYDEILGLRNQGLSTLVCCAAGYRSPDDKYATTPKVRFKASDVVTYL